MNIYAEFERLKQFVAKPGGWDSIERLWIQGTSCRKDNGDFEFVCTGIAIDPMTWEIVMGPEGFNHSWAHGELVRKILEQEYTSKDPENVDIDEIECRVKKAYLIKVKEWEFPFIIIVDWHMLGRQKLREVEERLLDLKMGLPLCQLFLEKNPGMLETMRKQSGDPT